jgi:hypothetical protein
MSIVLSVAAQPWFLATIAPVLPLLILALAYQPHSVHQPQHRHGVRATRVMRRLAAERKRARPRPTGWQSPAWTVQRELVQP